MLPTPSRTQSSGWVEYGPAQLAASRFPALSNLLVVQQEVGWTDLNRPDFGGDSILWEEDGVMAERSSSPHPTQWRYPPELRERAVRLVREVATEQGERHGAVTRVAKSLGIGSESVRLWVRQAEINDGERVGLTSAERARIKELERDNRELRRANEMADPQERRGFLRGGARPPVLEVTRYIDEQRVTFGVEPICRALEIAPSSYYAAKRRPPSAREIADGALAAEVAGSTPTTSASTGSARPGGRSSATGSRSAATG